MDEREYEKWAGVVADHLEAAFRELGYKTVSSYVADKMGNIGISADGKSWRFRFEELP